MAYLLHIDTSTDTGTVAINSDGIIIAFRSHEALRNHAATLNMEIESLMKESEISLINLSGIVVCAGPGSYTGLRIGLATAKGLCYALDIPLIMDNRLTLLAWQSYREYGDEYQQFISLIVARPKEYFIAIYDSKFNCTLNPQHITEDQLDNIPMSGMKGYMVSDGGDEIIAGRPLMVVSRDLKIALDPWADYAYNRFKCHDIEILSTSEPFYLKQVYTHK